jgi:hypothetical protein
VDILAALGKEAPEADRTKLGQYGEEKEQIQKKAEELEHQAKHHLHTHHLVARSVTLFQIAIVVGAISVLTRRRPFWYVSLAFGMIGLAFAVQSFLAARGH